MTEEGLDLDVVSGGELYTALAAGVDAKHIHFHGNNKTMQELRYALESGVGDIVVDNLNELHRIEKLSAEKGVVTSISIRMSLSARVRSIPSSALHLKTARRLKP